MKSTIPSTHPVIGATLSSASYKPVLTNEPQSSILCQGWVLKKRRKKMQGFARRYFILYYSGLLTYAFHPDQPVRDQISLHHAAISTAPGRKDIHIDSNTATFHLKCLSTEDFNTWMTAFRMFISAGVEARKSGSARHTPRQPSMSLNKSSTIIEEMGSTIAELEDAILSLPQVPPTRRHTSLTEKSEKDKHKGNTNHAVFGLFKKPSTQHPTTGEHMTENIQLDGSQPLQSVSAPLVRTQVALSALKTQHATLVKLMHSFVLDPNQTIHPPPLPYTAEEEERAVDSDASTPILTTPIARKSKRSSVATTVSDSVNEWYDALDYTNGPEEFVMEMHGGPDGEQPSQIITDDSRSSLDRPDVSSTNSDSEDEDTVHTSIIVPQGRGHVIRREQLPVPPVADEGSLFAILKKNVGKDLSTITFPVTFNEPLSLLQRAAEEFEYYHLLDKAERSQDDIEQICYIAAFVVSGYAHTRHRSGRKGFNPMLAETFEDIRMNFLAEKVCHNPLEMAYHAEGENWELCGVSCGKTKFWGKSLEIIPLGTTRLRVGQNQYVWNKPSSFMRNLMVGTKYFEHCGKMTIENTTNQIRCVLDFKQNGYWGPSNVVSGTVYSQDGEILTQLEGKWDDQLSRTADSSHFQVLWRMTPFPKTADEYYGFTSFGITLNEISSNLVGKLPVTDSRYRPDIRALENGELEVAEEEKTRVEEAQRDRRRRGQDRQPHWFTKVGDEWEYKGGYWEARTRGWKDADIQPLW